MKTKKGDVWISAALYFGLGVVVLAIILAAGTPVINKLRDKNIAVQTKEVMFTLDNNIREVARGGPGTQRLLHVDIKKGNFNVEVPDKIIWTYKTRAILSEPEDVVDWIDGTPIKEGNLNIMTKGKGSPYDVAIWLDYTDQVELINDVSTVQGSTDLIITNAGNSEGINPNLVDIIIKEKI